MTSTDLSRTVLAVSAFRSDASVIGLLEKAFAADAPRFGAVVVVDSLGSGAIEEEASRRGWPIRYDNAANNLGSAGNLARRLALAIETGLDWCLALNHDAALDPDKAAALVRCGEGVAQVGAVYPQLRLTSAQRRYDRPRREFSLFGLTSSQALTATEPVDVKWASSNGALYSLPAMRALPSFWPSLWMGYEDLALGWELDRAGWRQLLCPSVVVDDNYEFKAIGHGRLAVRAADKPAWYSYYQARNTILIARRSRWRAIGPVRLAVRLIADLAIIIALKPNKRERFTLWLNGLRDGLAGRDGKGPLP